MRWFDRIPDKTLNKVGRRYNLFCMAFLVPYVTVTIAAIVAAGFGWTGWRAWQFPIQVGWVLLWLPNLFLIGLRADRDFRAIVGGGKDFQERMAAADREFTAFHAKRMAWLRGELENADTPTPPTVN